jgi:hypothetical protein
VSKLLAALAAGHGQATFGADVHQTERAYRGLRAAAAGVLAQLSPELYPASYVQTCLYLHDAQCVLDRADDALFYARLGQLVLTASDGYEAGFSRPQVDDLLINAIRGEGVAYHNLGLERQVLVSCEQAQTTSAFRNAGDFWQPLVGRDRLNALANTPRFGRRDARALAHGLMTLCEQTGDAFTLYLVRDGWLRCLVQSEDWREAHRVLQAELDLLPRLPYVGPLHRALLFKTAAHLAWRQGDQAGWREHVRDFVRLARAAGLKHQLRLVRGLYGPALGAITEYLDVEPATSAYP